MDMTLSGRFVTELIHFQIRSITRVGDLPYNMIKQTAFETQVNMYARWPISCKRVFKLPQTTIYNEIHRDTSVHRDTSIDATHLIEMENIYKLVHS